MLYQQSARGNDLEKQASEGNLRSNIYIMGIAVSVEVINEEKVQVAADNLLNMYIWNAIENASASSSLPLTQRHLRPVAPT